MENNTAEKLAAAKAAMSKSNSEKFRRDTRKYICKLEHQLEDSKRKERQKREFQALLKKATAE